MTEVIVVANDGDEPPEDTDAPSAEVSEALAEVHEESAEESAKEAEVSADAADNSADNASDAAVVASDSAVIADEAAQSAAQSADISLSVLSAIDEKLGRLVDAIPVDEEPVAAPEPPEADDELTVEPKKSRTFADLWYGR